MTLLDAPTYDPAKAQTRKKSLIAGLVACLFLASASSGTSGTGQRNIASTSFSPRSKAAICPRLSVSEPDPDWQQHLQQYASIFFRSLRSRLGPLQRLGRHQDAQDPDVENSRLWSGGRRGSQRAKDARLPLGAAQQQDAGLLPGSALDRLGYSHFGVYNRLPSLEYLPRLGGIFHGMSTQLLAAVNLA